MLRAASGVMPLPNPDFRHLLAAPVVGVVLLFFSVPLAAQQPASPQMPASIKGSSSDRSELTNEQKDIHYIGHVELDLGGDVKIYGDDVYVYGDENRAVATGHVLFTQGENRLSAERGGFNT